MSPTSNCDDLGLAAGCLDLLGDLARCGFVAHVVDDDVRAAAWRAHRRSATDTARAARDERYFAGEIEHSLRFLRESAAKTAVSARL